MDFVEEIANCFLNHKFEMTCVVIEVLLWFTIYLIMRIKIPYRSAKTHLYTISFIALCILIIYTCESFAHFKDMENVIGIADNIFSGAIFSILCILAFRFEKNVKNMEEDKEKLSQNYSGLAKKYCKDNLVVIKSKGTEITYPIIWEGQGEVLIGNENNIIIEDSPEDFYQLPSIIENNFKEIFSIHDTSTIYNNIKIRVKKMRMEEGKLYLTTQRTTFYNSLVTNRAADYLITEGLSIREIFETGPKMTPLYRSKLSNHLGFNGFIESKDGYIVFVKRSKDVSIGKDTYGDSIGASIKTKYALDKDGEFTYDGLKNAIYNEISDELNIDENEIDYIDDSDQSKGRKIAIISIYRDCVECGKPQLLVYAKSTLSATDITKKFTDNKREKLNKKKEETDGKKHKLSTKDKKELKMLKDGSKLIWISTKDLINGIEYEENGIRIGNSYSSKGFVAYKKGKARKTYTMKLRMVPSASATIYMLKEYLKKEDCNKIINSDTNCVSES